MPTIHISFQQYLLNPEGNTTVLSFKSNPDPLTLPKQNGRCNPPPPPHTHTHKKKRRKKQRRLLIRYCKLQQYCDICRRISWQAYWVLYWEEESKLLTFLFWEELLTFWWWVQFKAWRQFGYVESARSFLWGFGNAIPCQYFCISSFMSPQGFAAGINICYILYAYRVFCKLKFPFWC